VRRSSVRRDANRGILHQRHRDATSGHPDVKAVHRVERPLVVGRQDRMADRLCLRASGVERPVAAVLVDQSN